MAPRRLTWAGLTPRRWAARPPGVRSVARREGSKLIHLPQMAKRHITFLLLVTAALGAVCAATPAFARNVDLSTVPKRNSVQLTIYNSEDLTLVRETRTVTFKKGVNPLQFSWANTLIDPTSRRAEVPDAAPTSSTCSTRPSRTTSRRCSIGTCRARSTARRRSRSPTSPAASPGRPITCCIADKDEKQLSFDGFVRVSNNSGEEYENAQVRLVVGTINLVEKIAQLAQIPIGRSRRIWKRPSKQRVQERGR